MPQLGISITASGPIFGRSTGGPVQIGSFNQGGVVATPGVFALDGARDEFEGVIHQTVAELARMGTSRLFQQGQPKPAGIFLSVAEARPGHVSTGNWRAHLVQTVGFMNATIEPGVVYGAWLEGVGSRNATTRFKGYAQFRKTESWLETQAAPVAERFAQRAVERLNG